MRNRDITGKSIREKEREKERKKKIKERIFYLLNTECYVWIFLSRSKHIKRKSVTF